MVFNFLIITHVQHVSKRDMFFGYSPYVNEMNIWNKYCDEVILVAPLIVDDLNPIYTEYTAKNITFVKIPSFNLISLKSVILSFFAVLRIIWTLVINMRQADHIHLRCPGNIGLLGCIVQIAFPSKSKTAKYAGNWDPKSKQPLSYRMQKWILSNTFLTRNIQVLVYGEWEGSTKNIKPFFTATYFETDKLPLSSLDLKQKIKFVFVGTLSKGKNPLYTIQLTEGLYQKGFDVTLDIYGEGIERVALEDYIRKNKLEGIISLKGNQTSEVVKKAYQNSHFSILPSKSEGWPKAIAEGMFFGCVPIATSVSCVPFMLGHGERGVLLQMNLANDIAQLESVLNNESDFENMRKKASEWSRNYTLNVFEEEVKRLLKG